MEAGGEGGREGRAHCCDGLLFDAAEAPPSPPPFLSSLPPFLSSLCLPLSLSLPLALSLSLCPPLPPSPSRPLSLQEEERIRTNRHARPATGTPPNTV